MARAIDRITLKGFKSIEALESFELRTLNVLIGANGAGKSNFVDYFRMLRAMADEAFQKYVLEAGGGDGFLFLGPKVTKQVSSRVEFGRNWFEQVLQPSASGSLLIASEATGYMDSSNTYSGRQESVLKTIKGQQSHNYPGYPGGGHYIYESVSSWTVYHFHDTSTLAPMRRDQSLRDWERFRHDASNIAPFLFNLKEEEPNSYELIRDTVRLIAPFFDDFLLRPQKRGENEVVRLEWQQKGSDFPFQPNQLSDGTIRFICLATCLLQPYPPATVVVDEPELGLHPYAISMLAEPFKSAEMEGLNEDNNHRFLGVFKEHLFGLEELSGGILLGYDQNIVKHTLRLNERRAEPIRRKYFQWLSLLFTEVYLDRFFRAPDKLLADLNEFVEKFNADKLDKDKIPLYEPADLRKIAFWNATGSGKTLLMHVNILQYQHYLELHGKGRELNRIILLTPNEGLSRQHLAEFHAAGLDADLFSKDGKTLFAGKTIEIIDIHKLREDMGEKTVAIDAFEGNNLVLVDEGHRGSSGKEAGRWMDARRRLCEQGFSFEYSATFGQAMKASSNKALEQEYAKCILFDYSYKYFYRDGFGKDYRILNLADDSDEDKRRLYLTACLLAFYQQQRLYRDKPAEFRPFLLEEPLWVFVGGSVNAVRSENKRKVSDVVDILLFLAEFVKDKRHSMKLLDRLLSGKPGLLDQKGREIFATAFGYLSLTGQTGEAMYGDILKLLFNSSSPARLHVLNLKGTDGEIALRLAENDAFGLIHVGDASALCKLCDEHPDFLTVDDKEFSGSLFANLSDADSTVRILIGSKKFTEGWNSWRVSTMGLMNVGKSEGSEIIQLFGRGVRLKGCGMCLKRSSRIDGIAKPPHISLLETLNIFGIRAQYMQQFKEYLEEEGLPANEERIEFILPVIENLDGRKLASIRLKEGVDFKREGTKPTLDEPTPFLLKHPVMLNWYPKIQAQQSKGVGPTTDNAVMERGVFAEKHLAFMDVDAIYFELQHFKNERAWYNLNLPRASMMKLLRDPRWYRLFIPSAEMEFTRFDRVRGWEEIAVALLKKYIDRYYKHRKQEWEADCLEYLSPVSQNRRMVLIIHKFKGEDVAGVEKELAHWP